MNQVHIVIGKHRTSHSSFHSAVSSFRSHFLAGRILHLIDEEIVQMLKRIFA